jgi:hypothetical protein
MLAHRLSVERFFLCSWVHGRALTNRREQYWLCRKEILVRFAFARSGLPLLLLRAHPRGILLSRGVKS